MSELTEDRTQRHFETTALAAATGTATATPTNGGVIPPSAMDSSDLTPSRRYRRPPSYIGVSASSHPKLDTINSSASSTREHRRSAPDEPSVQSYASPTPTKRLSVAQRARLEAERSSGTPVRVRAPGPTGPPAPLQRARSSSNSQSSFFNSMARSISDVIDKSVLGVPNPPTSNGHDDEPDDFSSEGSTEYNSGPMNSRNINNHNHNHNNNNNEDPHSNSDNNHNDDNDSRGRASSIASYDRGGSDANGGTDQYRRGLVTSPGNMTTDSENEKPVSEAGSTLSLQERQQIQRAQQIAFLREQGLMKGDGDGGLRGGAGAMPDRSSRTSTPKSTRSKRSMMR